MIAALVPVKRLDAAKSRLRPHLDARALEALTLAMLDDVLEALCTAPGLDRVAVVTEDDRVADAARKAGAEALVLDAHGLNPSLDAAAAILTAEGAGDVLVVLGDVPGITAKDVELLITTGSRLGSRSVVLSPAHDGGTAALLRSPHDVIPSCFGLQSAARHRDAATHARVPLQELALPGLAVDLDRPEDMDAFLRSPGAGRRTRACLASVRGPTPG